MSYNISIVGATGAVGRQLLESLYKRNFPFENITLLASKKSEGKKIIFKEDEYKVKNLESYDFKDSDIAFFSAGSEVSKVFAPEAEKKECYVIDNTSCFRMNKDIPLIVPEINEKELLESKRKIIANPNCSTIQMLVALAPIHKISKIKRIVVSTYQSVSGAGQSAIDELKEQTESLLEQKNILIKNIPKQIAFNVVPQIDVFLDNGFTKEEMKMVNETNKILDKNINVNATCVRVPSYMGHAESIYIELEKDMSIEDLERALQNAEGIKYSNSDYHTPIDSEGEDWVYVSRLRKDIYKNNIFNLWVVADNLLKGAALNSVQIGECLIKKKIVSTNE